MCIFFKLQVLYSSLIVREDMNVGSLVFGNLNRKSGCAHIRLEEVMDTIAALKNTQLNLIYCGFGLDEPTNDIISNVLNTLTLVGEFPQASELFPEIQPNNYVHVVCSKFLL